jgi:hypothetical protein
MWLTKESTFYEKVNKEKNTNALYIWNTVRLTFCVRNTKDNKYSGKLFVTCVEKKEVINKAMLILACKYLTKENISLVNLEKELQMRGLTK